LDSHHHCHTLSHCCLPFFTRLPPPFFATLFPYTTLFRSIRLQELDADLSGPKEGGIDRIVVKDEGHPGLGYEGTHFYKINGKYRSEEHTSELQSRFDLVCRLLLEKKKTAYSCMVSYVTCA